MCTAMPHIDMAVLSYKWKQGFLPPFSQLSIDLDEFVKDLQGMHLWVQFDPQSVDERLQAKI